MEKFSRRTWLYMSGLHVPENVVSKDFCQIIDFNGRTRLFSSDKQHICGVFLSFIHLL